MFKNDPLQFEYVVSNEVLTTVKSICQTIGQSIHRLIVICKWNSYNPFHGMYRWFSNTAILAELSKNEHDFFLVLLYLNSALWYDKRKKNKSTLFVHLKSGTKHCKLTKMAFSYRLWPAGHRINAVPGRILAKWYYPVSGRTFTIITSAKTIFLFPRLSGYAFLKSNTLNFTAKIELWKLIKTRMPTYFEKIDQRNLFRRLFESVSRRLNGHL